MRASILSRVGAELGEGPLWRSETAEVLWVDVLRGEVHALDLGGNDRLVATLGEPVGAIALDNDGRVLAATPRGLTDLDGRLVASIPLEAEDLRMNDGKPDPFGRFVGGTMTLDQPREGAGSLWSLDGSGSTRLVSGVTISNGLAWNAIGTELYWIDTPTGRVDVFDYDAATGSAVNRRTFVEIPADAGSPDGMCIDSEGGLWVALWGGGAVRRYEAGELTAIVDVPTPLVTCPTFAGDRLDMLVVTTASVDFEAPPRGGGDIYAAEIGVSGTEPHRLGEWAT
ncbi:MAG: SMP-30/gluconolactonase/LRE family protein [Acidimicrobiaceae bacterium]|nr:SMP-30/gluconolactonase/LRE family protein [Acidimicrobiaceae bacterium]